MEEMTPNCTVTVTLTDGTVEIFELGVESKGAVLEALPYDYDKFEQMESISVKFHK